MQSQYFLHSSFSSPFARDLPSDGWKDPVKESKRLGKSERTCLAPTQSEIFKGSPKDFLRETAPHLQQQNGTQEQLSPACPACFAYLFSPRTPGTEHFPAHLAQAGGEARCSAQTFLRCSLRSLLLKGRPQSSPQPRSLPALATHPADLSASNWDTPARGQLRGKGSRPL